MGSHLHVVAVGARTPVGFTARASAAAIRGRIGRFGSHPVLTTRSGAAVTAASDSGLPPTMPVFERVQVMATSALAEALGSIQNVSNSALPIDIVLGLPEPRPGYPADAHVALSRHLTLAAAESGFHGRVWPLALGHAAALEGLRQAFARLQADSHALFAIGGADSYLDPESMGWLESQSRLYNRQSDGGLTPGEGAAFLVVTSDLVQRSYDWPTLARVRGVHSVENSIASRDDPANVGEGLRQAIAGATSALHLPGETIETVIGDLNGERHRAEEWGAAALWAQPMLRGGICVTPASQWGDVGAASGALFMMLATEWFVRRCARGRRALVWAGSDQGLRAAALLEQG